uniref:Proline rich 5 like n=1 Tax=Canis lupus familiaris TaxID=9615 RepID=A0A8C0M8N8_CANLF
MSTVLPSVDASGHLWKEPIAWRQGRRGPSAWRLLKSELGSFITDYFQNQLLAKGLLFVEEKIKLCEGESRIEVLAEVWDHFFTETLPTLQAIFYPVQGQELTIRQISLLGFRDLVLLKVKLGDSLLLAQSQPPSSIVQMLLILQVGEGPTGAVAARQGEGETPRGGGEGLHDLGTLAVLVGSRSVWPFVFLRRVCWFAVRPLGPREAPGPVLHAGIPVVGSGQRSSGLSWEPTPCLLARQPRATGDKSSLQLSSRQPGTHQKVPRGRWASPRHDSQKRDRVRPSGCQPAATYWSPLCLSLTPPLLACPVSLGPGVSLPPSLCRPHSLLWSAPDRT